MPTKKKSKKVQSRKMQSAECRMQNASATSATSQRRMQNGEAQIASIEEQISALEEQIAALQAQCSEFRVQSQRREQSSESRDQSKREVQSKDGNQSAEYGAEHSAFCTLHSALPEVLSDTATNIQVWFEEMQTLFQNVSTLVPELGNTVLTTPERRRLNGSGVRRYGFADKVSDVAEQYPQFWPASVDFQDKLKGRLREIETLRNTLIWLRYVSRVVGDLLLLAGDDAFRMANTYYATVRTAARRHLPEAAQVFQMIELFWRRPRRTTAEPTIPEVERDVRALLRGTKDGRVLIENENDRVVKGERVVIDETGEVE